MDTTFFSVFFIDFQKAAPLIHEATRWQILEPIKAMYAGAAGSGALLGVIRKTVTCRSSQGRGHACNPWQPATQPAQWHQTLMLIYGGESGVICLHRDGRDVLFPSETDDLLPASTPTSAGASTGPTGATGPTRPTGPTGPLGGLLE